jgi:hypothetical protein
VRRRVPGRDAPSSNRPQVAVCFMSRHVQQTHTVLQIGSGACSVLISLASHPKILGADWYQGFDPCKGSWDCFSVTDLNRTIL